MATHLATLDGVQLVTWARNEAERLVAPLGIRWLHVRAVASAADVLAMRLGLDTDVLVAAAWLHDIGYAPDLHESGFHPIDGARHLRRSGVDERVVSLVANHSTAAQEAHELGLVAIMADEFPLLDAEHQRVLTYCDMTVGPRGERLTVAERIADVLNRYDRRTAVHRAMQAAVPELYAVVAEVERKLALQSQ